MTKRTPITILPDGLRNQIAAGEVVERPASVLKELVENSIDAGATTIDSTILGGGVELVQVADNGLGIPAEELPLAVTRHATSKLTSLEDLERIRSFGFRGEALPSIGSVSRLAVSSACTDDTGAVQEGAFVQVEYGELTEQGPTAVARGTRIEVRGLFGNVPARLKFLKTPATEARRCQDILFRISLANLAIGFTLSSNGRELFRMPREQDLISRLNVAWPDQVVQGLRSFDLEQDGFHVHGVAGSPASAQGRANRILLYVNNRPVTDRTLLAAVREAYRGKLLSKEHPQAVLFVSVPEREVDVNVHPAKTEVRFRSERHVFSLVRRAVLAALVDEAGPPSPGMSLPPSPLETPAREIVRPQMQRDLWTGPPSSASSDAQRSEPDSLFRSTPGIAPSEKLSHFTPEDSSGVLTAEELLARYEPAEKEPEPVPHEETQAKPWTYLGAFGNSYLLVSIPDDSGERLVLIDQHAAHERILFHKLSTGSCERHVLAIPLELSLHPSEEERLLDLWEELTAMGFVMQTRGRFLSVSQVPAMLDLVRAKTFLRDTLGGDHPDLTALYALMSCKAAIKAGTPLARDEALHLLQEWFRTPDRHYCPHGRPIAVSWSTVELEKLFKRT